MLEKFEIIESVIHVFTLRDQFWVVRGFISISRQLTGGSSSDGRSELLPWRGVIPSSADFNNDHKRLQLHNIWVKAGYILYVLPEGKRGRRDRWWEVEWGKLSKPKKEYIQQPFKNSIVRPGKTALHCWALFFSTVLMGSSPSTSHLTRLAQTTRGTRYLPAQRSAVSLGPRRGSLSGVDVFERAKCNAVIKALAQR